MKITIIAGARPNFIKIAPLINSLKTIGKNVIQFRLVHTGQHYDKRLSDTFFEELNIPTPDINLGVGSGSQAAQTAHIMIKFEEELMHHPTDYVVVVGDVNSTLACSVVAKKMNTGLIHIEAGIRSFDLTMPEEINRLVTDALADYFFTTSEFANRNLLKAGIEKKKIFFVGNIMIDSLKQNRHKFSKPLLWKQIKLESKKFWILTLHRPSNVDDTKNLIQTLKVIDDHCGDKKVIFPIHPRTEAKLKDSNVLFRNIVKIHPLGYLNFMYLVENCIGVITDSGGIQEETTVMKIPCITLRRNTERPETIEMGSNVLAKDLSALPKKMYLVLNNSWKKSNIPPKWDGKTADRIVNILITKLTKKK
jgi:UDP-N-acetylglucosamine 2-epimerase (non-hydrolysing)